MKEVANEFNQFFTSVGRRVSEDCESLIELYNLPARPTSVSLAVAESQNFSFVPVSREKYEGQSWHSNRIKPLDMTKYECLR